MSKRPPTTERIADIVEHVMLCGKHMHHHEIRQSAIDAMRFRLERVDVIENGVRQAPTTDQLTVRFTAFMQEHFMYAGMRHLLIQRVRANYFSVFGEEDELDRDFIYSTRVADGLLAAAEKELRERED